MGQKATTIPIVVSLGLLLGPVPQSAPPAQTAERMELVGQLGGLSSAVTTDGVTALAAEGETLLRLDISPGGEGPLPVIASLNLERGAIQAIVESFPVTYVLTEKGLLVMQGVHDAPLPQPVTFVPGGGQAMAVGQGTAYLAARDAGLRVIDVSVPQQAHALAELPLPGPAGDVALGPDGRLVFVATGSAGLQVVGVQNPARPALQATLDVGFPADSVAVGDSVLGPLLYVGGEGRLVALNLPGADTPTHPEVVGSYSPLGDGQRIALSPDGAFGYVADGEGGLKIYDLTAPDQPVQVYGDPAGLARGPASDVALSPDGALALVASGESGLRILDVSNPFSPVERFVVGLSGTARRVAYASESGLAYVSLGANGVTAINVASAAVQGTLPLQGGAGAVLAEGRWLYVALGESGLAVVRADRPGAETLAAVLPLPAPALDIALAGDTLFVAAGEAGLLAVDVLRRAEPRLVGQLAPDTAGTRYADVAVAGKRAFVADGQGVAIVDVADPAQMVHLTRTSDPDSRALSLAQAGIDTFLYVLSGAQIASHEVSISTAPALLGIYRPIERIGRIIPYADRLLLTNAGYGPQVVVLSASNPRLPRELGWQGDAGHSLDAAAHDDTLLVAGGLGGLARLAHDENGRLRPQGAYNPLPDLTRLALDGTRLLAGGGQGWSLLDAQNPTKLQLLSLAGEGLPVRGLAGDGEQVVILAAQQLLSYDVSNPLAPELVAQRELAGLANDVVLDARYVYVADGAGGLEILARTDLRPVTRIPLPAGANAVTLDSGNARAYLPLSDGTLAVVDVAEPTGGIRPLGTLSLGAPAALAVAPGEDRALALAGRELFLLEVGGQGELVRAGRAFVPEPGVEVAWDGERLAVLTPEGEMNLYALTDAGNPALLDSLPVQAVQAAGRDGVLYLARGEGGLAVLMPGADAVTVIDDAQPAYALLNDGDTLYAAGTRLVSYDLSAPDTARVVASLELGGPARHVAPGGPSADGGRWLYVSTVNGIEVVREAAGGTGLESVALVPVPSGVSQVIAGGNRAYAAPLSTEGGLLVLNTSDPAQPEPLFTYHSAMGATVQEMVLLRDRLLVSWAGGLELLDASAPSALPSLIATPATGGAEAIDAVLAQGRAYVSLGQDGIAVMDVSRPAEAERLGGLDTPGMASRAALGESVLFVADGPCGVRVLDVSNPGDLSERGYWLSGFTGDVAVSPDGGTVYAANGSAVLALRYLADGAPVPPPAPRDPSPPDGELEAPTLLQLDWGPPADSCNPLRYEVYLGVGASPPPLAQVNGEPGLNAGELRGLTTYRWQVRAADAQGDVSEGPLWSFTTGRAGSGGFVTPEEPPIFLNWLQAAWIPLGLVSLVVLALLSLRRRRRTNHR